VLARALREEPHHGETVVPGRDVVDQLAGGLAERAEHDRPAEHFGVAHLVELRPGHVEQRVGVAGLELGQQPAIEIELRMQVLGRAGEMRHAAARDDRHPFLAPLDDLGDRLAQRLASPRRRQRRHVDVGEERHHRDVAPADDVFERNREGVAELGVFGIRHVEAVVDDELVEDVLGQVAVNRQGVLAAGKLRDGIVAGDDRKRRDTRHRERFDVIGAEKENGIRLRLVEDLAELLHADPGLIELLRVLVGRPGEHVRGMTGADGSNDFAHVSLSLAIGSGGWRLEAGKASVSCQTPGPSL
jgi:hypothetical protein